ncbi:hypothetical protein HanRHA438_Chr10g0449241 [Helianthus annuus]|uniref:Uncharacterized protein n=1 Tax=Helianthus annuus TaxID=4232 RepID=A0A251TJK5_HELAN|nr:hypothetical protein HanXRQr2_Chr10g0437181 [Helianthus annuus]KAJ0513591.1 hypothetical protein HanHA300_Chr10g0359421 [Helianthus annuus]KAJ0521463.1 hypothetical protein HanIR_Chr10g0471151 [Helianthus annuus]KAJ0529705.1 hypothetical protein HanHA89_Chr10g0381021 [Helianthus annuus]KAJ0696576.1 hypothetical protein HanLR1_Chr10g0358741 [Helianthus annuus]
MPFIILLLLLLVVDIERTIPTNTTLISLFLIFLPYLSLNHTSTATATTVIIAPPPSVPVLCATI